MKKVDLAKLALSGWKLQDIKELVEMEKLMEEVDKPEDKPEDKPDDKPEDKPEDKPDDKPEDKIDLIEKQRKTIQEMEVLLKKLQDENARKNLETEKKSDDELLADIARGLLE